MTVEALIRLHQAISEFSYPLDLLKDLFCTIETPKAKLENIQKLQQPTGDFDYRELLDELWKRQQNEAQGDFVPYRHVYQSNPQWKNKMSLEEFQRKLVGLEILSNGLIVHSADREIVLLKQAPEKIASNIERMLEIKERGNGG